MNSDTTLHGECLVPGSARGRLALLSAPLSLWGGFDLETGRVCDVNHPQHGMTIAGRILAMPGGRGSSSSSSVLLASARLGIQPLAIILAERDPILTVGALVAEDLYGVSIPVLRLSGAGLQKLQGVTSLELYSSSGNAYAEPF